MSREFDLDEFASIRRALDVRPQSSRAERTIDITTTGARTGQPRRIEIWFHHVDGRWYLSGMPRGRSWYANLKANPRFIVHLKHGAAFDLPAIARPVDSDTKRRVLSVVLALQNRSDLGTAGVPLQDPEEWQERSPMVEIEFEEAPSSPLRQANARLNQPPEQARHRIFGFIGAGAGVRGFP